VTASVIGGPIELLPHEPEPVDDASAPVLGLARLIYVPLSVPGADRYGIKVAPLRLQAVVVPTEEGFVAEAPALGSLGYGANVQAALTDLVDAVRDYLLVLQEKQPKLAPHVAHHASYIQLLNVPEDSWFAAVDTRAPESDDAAEVE
jgi:hypothetical protein